MTGTGSIGERVETIARGASEDSGVELVHCQIAGSRRSPTVRVFIDKQGGVSVEDCALVSRRIEAVLDRDDFIPTSYVLEVSSPGIERGLFKLSDFEKFTGKAVRVRTDSAVEGQRNFSGPIVSVTGDEIDLEDKTRGRVRIPFRSIVKANLMVDLSSEFKKG